MSEPLQLPPVPPEMLEWAQAMTDIVNTQFQEWHDSLHTYQMESVERHNEMQAALKKMADAMVSFGVEGNDHHLEVQKRMAVAMEKIAERLS